MKYKSNDIPANISEDLQRFVKVMLKTSGGEKGDFSFELLRWSEQQPYWCVFACIRGRKGFTGIKGVSDIGGHYCIGKDENIHSVLSDLANSGWPVGIHSCFFD